MRVLVTGGAGFIGHELVCELQAAGHDVGATVHQHGSVPSGVESYKLDIRDAGQTHRTVREFDPEVTVHAAAMSDADECERNPNTAYEVNVAGTKNVASASSEVNAGLLFLSSSFVFSGDEPVHDETGIRAPVNVYGETKVSAEDSVIDTSPSWAIVRTDQPYGWPESWQSTEMVTWLLDELEESDIVEVFDDWWNNPIYISDLVESIRALIEQKYKGIYHAVGPEFINRYEWAIEIANIFGYDPDRIVPVSASERNVPAKRPNAHLSPSKLVRRTGVDIQPIHDGLERMVKQRE